MDISQLNWFDYCIIAIVAFSVLLGAKRGLLREIISLITLIAAFIISIIFVKELATIYIADYVQNETASVIISFIILFISTLIIGALINYIITSFVERVGIMWSNYLLGAVFGLLRGTLMVFLIVFLLVHTKAPEKEWFKKAQTPKMLESSINLVQKSFPTLMKEQTEKTKELSKKLTDAVQKDLEKAEKEIEE